MIDVMFYEAFKEEASALREFLPDDIKARFTDKTIQESGDNEPPSSLISIRTQSQIPIQWSKKVKSVLTRSHGYDHLLKFQKEAKENIDLGYLESYCARSVAEHAALAMLFIMRKIKSQMKGFEAFNRDGLTGTECQGRKALVVGVGCIGSEIVDIAKGMRMIVKGHDIDQKIKDLKYTTLDEGIKWADVVFCALPLTKTTEGLLNYKTLSKARPGLVFINISRGEISPMEDLAKLVDENILGGLSLDVYPRESSLACNLRGHRSDIEPWQQAIVDLSYRDNVLFTPHNAFNTQEALRRKASLSAESVLHYIKHKTFPCLIP